MSDLRLTMKLSGKLQKVSRSACIYGDFFKGMHIIIFTLPTNKVVIFEKNLNEESTCRICDDSIGIGKIVGNDCHIFLLSSSVNPARLYTLECNDECSYTWKAYRGLSFVNVLAITRYGKGFACLGLLESGQKQLITFDPDLLPSFEDFTFEELNENKSEDYYLKSVRKHFESELLLVLDNSSGKIYLCSDSGQSSLIYCSQTPLINALSMASEDCFSLWYANGKVVFHYFSQVCLNNCLYYNKKVVCVEKCFCNNSCFLWSDGRRLHHTEINFIEGQPKITNFKFQKNIVGVMSLTKVADFIIAHTINENVYELSPSGDERKEIIQANKEILSEIYNTSLKMRDIQKDIEVFSEIAKVNKMIQSDMANMKLSLEENFLKITNLSGMTFRRELWKMSISSYYQGLTSVKVVELEADLVDKMTMKVQCPFDNYEEIKVYLSAQFHSEVSSFCIGTLPMRVE